VAEKLNIGVSEIVAGLGHKKWVLVGCHVIVRLKWREQGWEHVSNYMLAEKVRVMVFCTALSQGTRAGCITVTRIEKPVTWILSPHFSQKIKIQDSTFSRKVMLNIFWDYRGISHQRLHGQRYENQLWELLEDPKKIDRMPQSHLSVKKSWCFFNMIMQTSTLILPL